MRRQAEFGPGGSVGQGASPGASAGPLPADRRMLGSRQGKLPPRRETDLAEAGYEATPGDAVPVFQQGRPSGRQESGCGSSESWVKRRGSARPMVVVFGLEGECSNYIKDAHLEPLAMSVRP